jgi:NhaC family Na+:H+ antiporter
MDLLIALGVSFLLLLVSALRGYFIAYPLLLSMGIFLIVFYRRGFPLAFLLRQGLRGSQKSFGVINVLLLIGAVTASWMAAGTVPAIVYYGIQLINPHAFVLAAFILTSLVSLLIGTSFGTAGTIGLALMLMASGSDVNPSLIAGAILSGAYLGDRCSPMSSSANLIATITHTDLYINIQQMWRTSLLPLLLTLLIYGGLSVFNPVQLTDQTFLPELDRLFQIHPLLLLPAGVILVLAFLKIEVKWAMLGSIGVAVAIALLHQQHTPLDLTRFILLGFSLDEPTPLKPILLGGGILSMLRVTLVVVVSTAFVGIFSATRSLHQVETLLHRIKQAPQLPPQINPRFLTTALAGIATATFGCTQTIAILLTQELVHPHYTPSHCSDFDGSAQCFTEYYHRPPSTHPPIYSSTHPPSHSSPKYEENEKANTNLALDLENTVVVLSPLIPWNIAGLVPATVLNVDAGFIPFAVYLYLIPLVNLLCFKREH